MGGELFAEINGRREVVSPPPGYVLVFPSVKLEAGTSGRLKALVHGSQSDPTIARLALVTFIQLVTDPPVEDAALAIKRGIGKFRLVTGRVEG